MNYAERNKGRSPFCPGQPVPVELFVGRRDQLKRIGQRGAAQTEQGKPTAFFVEGEYGIGKSSPAGKQRERKACQGEPAG